MVKFILEHLLEIIFGIAASITSILAVYYAIKSYRLAQSAKFGGKKGTVEVFFTREDMIKGLYTMYERVHQNDLIWFQTVGMSSYPGDIEKVILRAASQGTRFRMILNKNAPALDEFKKIFSAINTAEMVEAIDNNIRIQGLSDKEVIIAFPSLSAYLAIRFTDKNFVTIIKNWFDDRYEKLARTS